MTSLLVAAIDLGTTFSGYAFSTRNDYKNNPLTISAPNWSSGNGQLKSTTKISTCILFDPTKTFYSFGYDAEEKYSDLAVENNHHDWYYFRRFKMMLYKNETLTRDTMIEDDTGKKMTAMKVFSSAICYLKDQLLFQCENQFTDIEDSDINWVITVPAIWNDRSKQFMREAAEKAGVKDKLMIALEPEAASLYCMYQPIKKDSNKFNFRAFIAGEKYMVIDAGGGTIDITVHEVQINGSVKELHKANGGDWGGTKVDASFINLLADIVGQDVLEAFKSDKKYDFLSVLNTFEAKKRKIDPNLNALITLVIPMSLKDVFCDKKPNDSITAKLSESKYKDQVTWKDDKFRMAAQLAKTLFDECCSKIVSHIKELFLHPEVKDVPSILLVGGFAESLMLQTAIREAFKNKRLIIPDDADLAVLKGAVLYGHEPKNISGRICKYTYGIMIKTQFICDKHPKSKKVLHNNIEYCDNIFSIHVRVGEIVEIGEPQVKQPYVVVEPNQKSMEFKIFTSHKKDPTYTTEEGCLHLGTFCIDMPDTSKGVDRGVIVHMTFSGTEITVTAVDRDNPERAVTSKVDFLG